MKIWIPTVGTSIRLTADWTFDIRRDYRNVDVMPEGEPTWPSGSPPALPSCTVPAGTVLKVHRIYIRGNARDYDSVTFHAAKGQPWTSSRAGKRFFAGLEDVNKIEAEPYEP